MRSNALTRYACLILATLTISLSQEGVTEPTMYFVHNDHLGTPVAMTDQNQTVVWRASREPFGATTTSGVVEDDTRFPGQIFDEETGYHYNYFRDYDPSTGRYIQSDPIGLNGGLNTYAYVLQNPVRHTDQTGTGPIGIALALACEVVNAADTYVGFQRSGNDLQRVNLIRESIRRLDEADASCPVEQYGSEQHRDLLNYRQELFEEQLQIAVESASPAQAAAVGGFRALLCAAFLALPF